MFARIAKRRGQPMWVVVISIAKDSMGMRWINTKGEIVNSTKAANQNNYYFNSFRWAKAILCRKFNIVEVTYPSINTKCYQLWMK